jgi:adenosine deaminase
MSDDDFLRSMPKVELHLHLEGSIRPPLLLELARRNQVDLGAATVEEVTARYAFRDFHHFIELYLVGMAALRSGQDVLDAIAALATDLAAQNVRYAEVTTTAYLYFANGTPTTDYRDALDLGARRAREAHGLDLRWIVDIPRSIEDPTEGWTADLLTGPLAPADVVAIGLGGPEAEYPPEWYRSSFDRARAAGVPAVVHAGEVAGPPSVRGAIDALKSVRIGHGVRSMEDPSLVRELVDRQVPIEVSVTSNVLLGVFPSVEEHPLPAMLDAGLNVSVNTDDPGYFSTTLNDEHLLVHHRLGVDVADLVSAQRRAIDAALCEPARKADLHAALAAHAG